MPVANGTTSKKYEYKVKVSNTDLNFTSYVPYTNNADGSIGLQKPVLLYVRPVNNQTPPNAQKTGSNFYQAAAVFENGKWKTIVARKPDSEVHGWLRKMAFMQDGTIVIVGIPGYLAFYYPDLNIWKYLKTPLALQMNSITCNEKDVMLMGSKNGLYQYRNYNFT